MIEGGSYLIFPNLLNHDHKSTKTQKNILKTDVTNYNLFLFSSLLIFNNWYDRKQPIKKKISFTKNVTHLECI